MMNYFALPGIKQPVVLVNGKNCMRVKHLRVGDIFRKNGVDRRVFGKDDKFIYHRRMIDDDKTGKTEKSAVNSEWLVELISFKKEKTISFSH